VVDHFQRAGLTFPVRDDGPATGEVVVLLHGFPQDASAFDEVVPALHERGLRTLVPTQRGYAATARPRRRRDYRTAEVALDLLALVDAAGADRAHLVGHDWGAAPAWALAAWQPDRVGSLTVLATPHPMAMAKSWVSSRQALKSWYMAFFQLPWLPELVIASRLRDALVSSGLPERYADRYARQMAESGALTGALNWYRGIPFSARRPVPRIQVPTTYVWGRQDFALAPAAPKRTGQYVDADYRFEEWDAGHWLPETRPADVAAAILRRIGRG
jgi:pimeloyl-ACP methyl ester carboxylesterase